MKQDYIECGDSAELLKTLPDKSIDMVLTSPPYDNLRKYNGFTFDFETIAKELYRVTKEGGVVVWVVGDETVEGSETGTSFRQALFFKDIGFNLHDTMIYEKKQACFGSNLCYLQSFEYMFVFSKNRPKTTNLIYDRPNKLQGLASVATGSKKKNEKGVIPRRTIEYAEVGRRKNIWCYSVGGGDTGHPAVFPYDLAKDHILSWSNEGDLVLDCFMGSGTTIDAAIQNKRHYIGFEISEEYCEIARKRIEGAIKIANQITFDDIMSNSYCQKE